MRTVELDLCTDCLHLIAYDDYGDCDDAREKEMRRGLSILRKIFDSVTVSNDEPTFGSVVCDCCETKLAGDRHRGYGLKYDSIKPVPTTARS
jgi:hypothetical protein